MAHVQTHRSDVDLESSVLVEGLPGVGLVGKIATDHLVETLETTYVASLHCDGIPDVAVYQDGDPAVQPPVRIYAAEDHDLLALQSDVPISPTEAGEFASCLTEWVDEHDGFPLYLSGLPAEKDGRPEMHGIATGEGADRLATADVAVPPESGMVSGPTGALISQANRSGLDGVGLIVQSNPQFPDPEAARVLLLDGIQPITGVDVNTDKLVEQADRIAEAREQLAKQMSQGTDESTQAQPLGMFQ